MTEIFDGKKISEIILDDIAKEIRRKRLKLKLAVISVGKEPVSQMFIRQKQKACEAVGIEFELFQFPKKITMREPKREVELIAGASANTGVIVQLPIPRHMDTQEILNVIPTKKDIDVLSEASLAKFYTDSSLILPPVVGAVARFFQEYGIEIGGKFIVIIGFGRLTGKPLATWFLNQKSSIAVVRQNTPDISRLTKMADILISGVGRPDLITGSMIKRGAAVIDVGASLRDGKIAGDVEFKTAAKKTSFITPVPGGIGPVTTAVLLQNLLKLKQSHGQ